MSVIDVDDTPATLSDRVRVLVVDSHPLVRWALVRMINDSSDLIAVGEAESPEQALPLAFAFKPDVVTMDCSDGSGWRVARALRERRADLGIVVLTADGSDTLLFKALDSGASAYLSKTSSVHEVMSAIRHAAVAASSFSAAGLATALRRRNEPSADRLTLSHREHEVLMLLRDGYSVPEVAKELYVSLSTAKTYVARLYQKLGANNRAQALMTAVARGVFDDAVAV
jgi:DNA-binding NarL/FixJ family response regulator